MSCSKSLLLPRTFSCASPCAFVTSEVGMWVGGHVGDLLHDIPMFDDTAGIGKSAVDVIDDKGGSASIICLDLDGGIFRSYHYSVKLSHGNRQPSHRSNHMSETHTMKVTWVLFGAKSGVNAVTAASRPSKMFGLC